MDRIFRNRDHDRQKFCKDKLIEKEKFRDIDIEGNFYRERRNRTLRSKTDRN